MATSLKTNHMHFMLRGDILYCMLYSGEDAVSMEHRRVRDLSGTVHDCSVASGSAPPTAEADGKTIERSV